MQQLEKMQLNGFTFYRSGKACISSHPIWKGGGGWCNNIASQQEGTKLDLHLFKGLHAVPVAVWVSSGYSGFFPQSKTMHWLI